MLRILGAPLFHVKHYPWKDWAVTGYTGMGIWDFMTDWQDSLTSHLQAVLSRNPGLCSLRFPRTLGPPDTKESR